MTVCSERLAAYSASATERNAMITHSYTVNRRTFTLLGTFGMRRSSTGRADPDGAA
jgi:hypothetical protein